MTTETNRIRPQGLSRIDPALRDAAAKLDIVEFSTESLPAERERVNGLAAERATAVDTGGVAIESRSVTAPGGALLGIVGNKLAAR